MNIHYVIGSGPGTPPSLPCSTVYLANGAIARLDSISCTRSVHLITEQLLHKLPANDKGVLRQELLRGRHSDTLVTLGASRHNHELLDLEYFNYRTGKQISVSPKEKKLITNKFLGRSLALQALLRGAPVITGLRSIVREILYGCSTHHSLRASTGVFAIIYAIAHTPAHENIVIVGIGGTSNRNVDSGAVYAPNGHMPSDNIILKHIGRHHHNVLTIDEELSKRTKIPLFRT